jgi:hypothetical protein
MKKISLFAIALLIMAVSCKKEEKKIRVYRNGRIIEIDAPASPLPDIKHKKSTPPADGKYPEMSFPETEFDFGDINPGDKVTHYFSFENTGEADLVISEAVGSCGCTVPEYPKEAIKPGGTGKIKVTFNSSGKHGIQHKTVTLTTNTETEKEKLHIKASINGGSGTNMQPVATPNK